MNYPPWTDDKLTYAEEQIEYMLKAIDMLNYNLSAIEKERDYWKSMASVDVETDPPVA